MHSESLLTLFLQFLSSLTCLFLPYKVVVCLVCRSVLEIGIDMGRCHLRISQALPL
jgi:hypothetical protein